MLRAQHVNSAAAPTVQIQQVRPLAGQKGLMCGVDTNAGAKDGEELTTVATCCLGQQLHTRQERNDDRIAAQDLHELGFLTGIFDGHRGQGSHPVPELSYKHNNVYLAGGSCAEFAARPSGPEGPEIYENLHTQAGQQMLH